MQQSDLAARRRRKFTVDEVLRMVETGILSDDDRLELLDGELVLMPPQHPPHSTSTSKVRRLLDEAYGSKYYGREHSPVIASSHSMPEPDVALVRGRPQDYDTHHPSRDDTIIVVEVVKTTLRDARLKIPIYAKAGFDPYWLIDVVRGCVEVYTKPQPNGTYGDCRVLGPDDYLKLPGKRATIAVRDILPTK